MERQLQVTPCGRMYFYVHLSKSRSHPHFFTDNFTRNDFSNCIGISSNKHDHNLNFYAYSRVCLGYHLRARPIVSQNVALVCWHRCETPTWAAVPVNISQTKWSQTETLEEMKKMNNDIRDGSPQGIIVAKERTTKSKAPPTSDTKCSHHAYYAGMKGSKNWHLPKGY